MIRAFIENWRVRHRHPASLVLHAVGIPMLPLAGVLAVYQWIEGAWGLWWRPVGLIVLSYMLQWAGHAIEGSPMGEWMLIKKAWARRTLGQRSPAARTKLND